MYSVSVRNSVLSVREEQCTQCSIVREEQYSVVREEQYSVVREEQCGKPRVIQCGKPKSNTVR